MNNVCKITWSCDNQSDDFPPFFSHRLCEKSAFIFFFICRVGMHTQRNRETPLKPPPPPWRVGFHSLIITVYYQYYFKAGNIFFKKVNFETEIWRDKYLLLLLSNAEKKRATKILIIVALFKC